MIKYYRNLSVKMRKTIFLVLVLLGIASSIASYLVGLKPLRYVGFVVFPLALVGVFLSPDSREWYRTGDLFVRFSLWSREHLLLLTLIIVSIPAAVVTIDYLFVTKDTRKYVIIMAIFVILIITTPIITRYYIKKLM